MPKFDIFVAFTGLKTDNVLVELLFLGLFRIDQLFDGLDLEVKLLSFVVVLTLSRLCLTATGGVPLTFKDLNIRSKSVF